MGRLATVTAVHPSSRFGELAIDGGMITSFAEKPQVTQGWINGGYFVFNRAAFDLLDPEQERAARDGPARAARRDGRARRTSAQRLLAVHGHVSRDAAPERHVAKRARRPGGSGTDGMARALSHALLERPPRLRHRSHGLQGRVADGAPRAARGAGVRLCARSGVGSRASSRRRASAISAVSNIGDIRDEHASRKRHAAAEPEIVFHLGGAGARQAGARGTGRDLLDQCHGHGSGARGGARRRRRSRPWSSSPATRSTTTSSGRGPTGKDDRLGGKEPYGASKACAEIVVEAYRHSYFSGPSGPCRRHGARRQRHRRRRLGRGPPHPRRDARLLERRSRSSCAIRPPCGPGSTCSSRSSGYLRLAEALVRAAACSMDRRPPSTSAPRRGRRPGRGDRRSARGALGRRRRLEAGRPLPALRGAPARGRQRQARVSASAGRRAGGSRRARPDRRLVQGALRGCATCRRSRCRRSTSTSMPDADATQCCRSCGTPLSHVFVDLGMSPISNAMRRPEEARTAEPFYPLAHLRLRRLQARADRGRAAGRDALPRQLHLLLVLLGVVARARASATPR